MALLRSGWGSAGQLQENILQVCLRGAQIHNREARVRHGGQHCANASRFAIDLYSNMGWIYQGPVKAGKRLRQLGQWLLHLKRYSFLVDTIQEVGVGSEQTTSPWLMMAI